MNRCFNQEFTPNWTIHRLFSWNRRKFLKKVFNQFQGIYIAKYIRSCSIHCIVHGNGCIIDEIFLIILYNTPTRDPRQWTNKLRNNKKRESWNLNRAFRARPFSFIWFDDIKYTFERMKLFIRELSFTDRWRCKTRTNTHECLLTVQHLRFSCEESSKRKFFSAPLRQFNPTLIDV